jgi:hypothetical protein
MLETILFVWIFGMNKGWREINLGADIKLPVVYKYVMMTITPVLLILVFLGSVFTPKNNDWAAALSGNWVLDNGSLIKQITNAGLREQIALSTDPALTAQLEEKLWFINLARILLIGLFVGISVLVYIAHKKHQQQKHRL